MEAEGVSDIEKAKPRGCLVKKKWSECRAYYLWLRCPNSEKCTLR